MMEDTYIYPEKIKIASKHESNLYSFYELEVPTEDLTPEKKDWEKLNRYAFFDSNKDFAKMQNYLIAYLSLTPIIKKGENIAQALFRVALEIAAEESTGTWTTIKTLDPDWLDEASKRNLEIWSH